MWEIFSGGETPYGRTKNIDVVNGVCHQNQRLSRPPKCPDVFFGFMYACWNQVCHIANSI